MIRRLASGFTLIEVLVALVIVALVMAAALRATGVLVNGQERLASAALAGWSAENQLAGLRLARQVLAIGRSEDVCPQLEQHLVCVREVTSTPNPAMRRIDIRVYAESDVERSHVLARRIGFFGALP